jgi:8-oxo-dGTP diphosphatase
MTDANAASVALIHGDEVLLIRRAFAPFRGLWTLPGGRREPGETIEDCATREVHEELGLRIFELRPVMTMAIGEAQRRFQLAVFATTRFEGAITPSNEIADYRWLAPIDLHRLSTTPDLDKVLRQAFAP